jgi:hypothetical protein
MNQSSLTSKQLMPSISSEIASCKGSRKTFARFKFGVPKHRNASFDTPILVLVA